ncbi:gag-pol polyprotein [Tanacetum coccineum]|uniref:Gag-pol polyprotein n=1 Tax=Tanacetum coccineum TaxID=301880 RepID=A0ABQ4XR06_9ASTR
MAATTSCYNPDAVASPNLLGLLLVAATRSKGNEISRAPSPLPELETKVVNNKKETPRDKEIDKLVALISKSFKKIYKPTNNNIITSSNTRNKNVDTTLRIGYGRQTGQYENKRAVNVIRNRETVGNQIVQQTEIQCYNCKWFGHTIKECKSAKRIKDSSYHKDKMSLCKQEEAWVHNTTPDSSDMSNNGGEADQDEQNLEASNKVLEASKKFLASEFERYNDVNFVKEAGIKCAEANGLIEETKIKCNKKNTYSKIVKKDEDENDTLLEVNENDFKKWKTGKDEREWRGKVLIKGTKVDDCEFIDLLGVLLVVNVDEQRWIYEMRW